MAAFVSAQVARRLTRKTSQQILVEQDSEIRIKWDYRQKSRAFIMLAPLPDYVCKQKFLALRN